MANGFADLPFSSPFSYDPRGTSDTARLARVWTVDRLKSDRAQRRSADQRPKTTTQILAELCAAASDLDEVVAPLRGAVLVPVPSSSLTKAGSLWVPRRLCDALVEVGLGASVDPCLHRVRAVRKAATAQGNRPGPIDHYTSIELNSPIVAPTRVVLIDDVVTSGGVLIACARRIREAFANVEVRGFAMVRTMGYYKPFTTFIDPCPHGTIKMTNASRAHRDP